MIINFSFLAGSRIFLVVLFFLLTMQSHSRFKTCVSEKTIFSWLHIFSPFSLCSRGSCCSRVFKYLYRRFGFLIVICNKC